MASTSTISWGKAASLLLQGYESNQAASIAKAQAQSATAIAQANAAAKASSGRADLNPSGGLAAASSAPATNQASVFRDQLGNLSSGINWSYVGLAFVALLGVGLLLKVRKG